MSKVRLFKHKVGLRHHLMLLMSIVVLFAFTQGVFAAGIFDDKRKAQHALSAKVLQQLSVEFKRKFGQEKASSGRFNADNPWEKRKSSVNSATWGECRDYGLAKRNRCYREGRDAYRCEQLYEARSKLCDSEL